MIKEMYHQPDPSHLNKVMFSFGNEPELPASQIEEFTMGRDPPKEPQQSEQRKPNFSSLLRNQLTDRAQPAQPA